MQPDQQVGQMWACEDVWAIEWADGRVGRAMDIHWAPLYTTTLIMVKLMVSDVPNGL